MGVLTKKEAKKMGAWVSFLGGLTFVLGAASAVYIGFFMKPEAAFDVLTWIGRTFHHG